MSFIRNIWYAAAWSNELGERPIGRVVIGEPVALYRRADGSVAAIEDRCPHRHAPLSLGRVEGDRLRCMYHGLQFDADGRCVHIPGAGAPAVDIRARTFAVVERDSWLWIWMGDPALADPALIPAAFGIDTDAWLMREGALDYAANYQLINDNLTDLSHLDFVHETTLGAATGSSWSADQPAVSTLDHGVRVDRWFTGVASPADPAVLNDVWNSYHYWLPGVFIMTTDIFPAGAAAAANGGTPSERAPLRRVEQQAVTPIDDRHTRYLFATGFEAGKIPPAMIEPVFAMVTAAFAEDRAMIEAQQRIWDRTPPDAPKRFIPQDKAPAIFRRLIARRLAMEAEGGAHAAIAEAEALAMGPA